jgi:hypothetical protein
MQAPPPDHNDPFESGGMTGGAPTGVYGSGSPYGGASFGGTSYGRYNSPYSTGYSNYGNYGGMGGLGMTGGGMYGSGRYGGGIHGGIGQAQAGSAAVLSGMQEAMQRFARVSGMLEEVLRNVHLLFDGVFGLGYSLGAFHEEARMWLSVKSGPAAFVLRLLKSMKRLWRLVALFICSPMAGRFSPVALVLRVLGVAPEDTAFAIADADAVLASTRSDSRDFNASFLPSDNFDIGPSSL